MRKVAETVYYTELKENRSVERVLRSRGCVTSPQILTALTSHPTNPMAWSDAHNLVGKCAEEAWNHEKMFYDVLLTKPEITSRITSSELKELTDPLKYIGKSKEIIRTVFAKYWGQSLYGDNVYRELGIPPLRD
jgi:adenylosuccinate lyase